MSGIEEEYVGGLMNSPRGSSPYPGALSQERTTPGKSQDSLFQPGGKISFLQEERNQDFSPASKMLERRQASLHKAREELCPGRTPTK